MTIEDEYNDALTDDIDWSVPPLDMEQATIWAIKLQTLRQRIYEYEATYLALVERMTTFKEEETNKLEDECALLEEALMTYHRVAYDNDPKNNITIKLLNGTVLKSGEWGGEKWVYEDEDAFKAWVIENIQDAVDYPDPKINKNDAKKAIKELALRFSDGKVQLADNTVVPGLTIEKPVRQFKVVP